MANWRDELTEVVKTKAEREAEEKERHRKRVEEALTSAEAAMQLARDGLVFTRDRVVEKGQPCALEDTKDALRSPCASGAVVGCRPGDAIIKVTFIEGKPRDFASPGPPHRRGGRGGVRRSPRGGAGAPRTRPHW